MQNRSRRRYRDGPDGGDRDHERTKGVTRRVRAQIKRSEHEHSAENQEKRAAPDRQANALHAEIYSSGVSGVRGSRQTKALLRCSQKTSGVNGRASRRTIRVCLRGDAALV